MTDLTLENAAALVVGAGQGIGRSVALALATDGADVALAARRAEPLERLAAEVAEATGRRTLAVVTDVADPSQGRAAVEATVNGSARSMWLSTSPPTGVEASLSPTLIGMTT